MEIIKEVEELEDKIEKISSERYNFIEECLYGVIPEKLKKYKILNNVFLGKGKAGHLTKSFIEFIRKKESPKKKLGFVICSPNNRIEYNKKTSFYLKKLEIWDGGSNQKYWVLFSVSRFTIKKIEDLTHEEWECAKQILSLIKRYLPLFLKESNQLKQIYESLIGTV